MEVERRPPRPPPPRMSSLSTQEHVSSFQELQRLHDNAHRHVNFGLEADERSSVQEALESYNTGLQLLNKALMINCENLSCSTEHKDQAKQMQHKMLKTKQQITFRLQTLQNEHQDLLNIQARTEADAPPSYEQAVSNSDFNTNTDMQSLENSLLNDEPDSLNLTNTVDLYSIENGVQIFYITAEGYVSAPSYPSALHVLRFEDNQAVPGSSSGEQRPPAFLHVGDWLYPLVPGSSPALQSNFGAYLFPDLMSSQPGAAVGVILPQTLSSQERQRFEAVIQSFTIFEQQLQEGESTASAEAVKELTQHAEGTEEDKDMAAKISKGILVAADWIAWGVGKGAEKAGELIKTGSEKLKEHIQPSDKAHKMDPRLQKGVVYARQATHATVQVTGYLVNKLGEATSALAREIAPHIRSKGEKFIPKSLTKENSNGKSKLDGVVEVAASGLQGFGTVYVGLEAAAKTLGRSIANETVHVVNHKYGEEAGNVAEQSVYAAGNIAMTAFNAKNFGIKAMAKRTAKDTGKAVLEDINRNKSNRGYNPCESDTDESSQDYVQDAMTKRKQ